MYFSISPCPTKAFTIDGEEEEGAAAEKAQEEARKARLKALREQQKAEMEAQAKDDANKPKAPPTKFASEEERRAYAASVVAQTANGRPTKGATELSKGKGSDFNTKGVSNDDLINDLFGL